MKNGECMGLTRLTFSNLLAIVFNVVFILVTVNIVYAFRVELSDESRLDIDTTVKYGLSMRVDNPDSELLANINGDDGNRAFEKWDLTSNMGMIRTEIDFQYKNIGLFTRARAFYDYSYMHDNSNDSPATNNNFVGGSISDHKDFTDEAEDLQGADAEIFDFFVYGNFLIAERELSLRVGKQVVSWGESLATFNSISAAQSYADATMLNVPGMELKDLFLPSWQISAQIDVVDNLTFSGYYQWSWDKNRLDAAGTFFSTADMIDRGGFHYLAAPGVVAFNRGKDDWARDSGQWGMALRYMAENLNDTEFTFCVINYHEKMPLFYINPAVGNYYLGYDEDVKLYGLSAGTVIGNTNIGAEISYRKDLSVAVDGPLPTYEPFDVYQVLVNGIHIFGPLPFADNLTLLFEGGYNEVLDADNLAKDTSAWGYLAKFTFDYFNVLPMLDLKVVFSYKQKVHGKSSVAATWTKDEDEFSVGLNFLYLQDIKFDLLYVNFLGDAGDYAKSDRDYMSFNVRYTF